MVWQKHAGAQGEKTKQQEILNPGGYDLPSPIPSTTPDAHWLLLEFISLLIKINVLVSFLLLFHLLDEAPFIRVKEQTRVFLVGPPGNQVLSKVQTQQLSTLANI